MSYLTHMAGSSQPQHFFAAGFIFADFSISLIFNERKLVLGPLEVKVYTDSVVLSLFMAGRPDTPASVKADYKVVQEVFSFAVH